MAVIRTPTIGGGAQFGAIQGAAPSFGVEVTPVDARDPDEIERRITAFVRGPTDGLIVTVNALTTLHRERIIALAARLRLPAVYHFRYFVTGGGLISYGPDPIDQFRRAAGYVDRILRGEKPADLPVQNPTKYETVLNMKTARALGLDVPAEVLVRAMGSSNRVSPATRVHHPPRRLSQGLANWRRAQQAERVRRIGVLTAGGLNAPIRRPRFAKSWRSWVGSKGAACGSMFALPAPIPGVCLGRRGVGEPPS